MHINTHFAVGVIIASFLNYYLEFNLMEFILIIIFSFICDFDVFFANFAKDNNHRMLITHSIIPSGIIIFNGIIFNWSTLIISGFTYLIHIVIDTIDWGTNFFYFNHKQMGLKLLITKEESDNLSHYLSKYKIPASFFDNKYYNNKACLVSEILLFIFMWIFILIFAFHFVLVALLYFLGLYFHLSRHFYLKKSESE
jgi:hypothetical protein